MKALKKVSDAIRFLTVHQWKLIDEDYKTETEFNIKVLYVLVACAVVLLIGRYFCGTSFFLGFDSLQRLFAKTRYPMLCFKLCWAFSTAFNYFFIPALMIKFVLKERIRDYGFHLDKSPKVLALYAGMFMAVIPLVYLVSFSQGFLNKYPYYDGAANSYTEFIVWHLAWGFEFFMLEFFFRGFFIFALARYLGSYAIFVMTVPYCMIHFGKPLPEATGAIITGIALGTLALRTRSIYGGVVLHVTIAWSMDFFSLWQKGLLQRLFLG